MTSTVRSPRAVVERLLHTASENAWEEFVELYADDAVIEMPFAPPGVPKRRNTATMRVRLLGVAADRPWTFQRATNVVLHETTDPEVVVVECDLHGVIAATDEPMAVSFVMVITVRDGKIVHARDYGNPLATQELLKRSPGLAEASSGAE